MASTFGKKQDQVIQQRKEDLGITKKGLEGQAQGVQTVKSSSGGSSGSGQNSTSAYQPVGSSVSGGTIVQGPGGLYEAPPVSNVSGKVRLVSIQRAQPAGIPASFETPERLNQVAAGTSGSIAVKQANQSIILAREAKGINLNRVNAPRPITPLANIVTDQSGFRKRGPVEDVFGFIETSAQGKEARLASLTPNQRMKASSEEIVFGLSFGGGKAAGVAKTAAEDTIFKQGVGQKALGFADDLFRSFGNKSIYASENVVVKGGRKVLSVGENLSSKIPGPVKTVGYYTGVGGLYTAGAKSTDIGTDIAAGDVSKSYGLSPEASKDFVRSVQSSTQVGAFGGKQEVKNADGSSSFKDVAPKFGTQDLIGEGQRFVLGGAPGLASYAVPDITREGVVTELKKRNIPATEKNIEVGINAVRTQGLFSTGGIFVSEAASNLGVGRFTRGGSPALSAAKTIPEQRAALRSVIVPPTIVAGIFEGGTQSYNVQSLTGKPKLGEVAIGGALGGASAGLFSVATAQFVPSGKGRLVQIAGYGLDFPGEPAGDILSKVPQKALRQEGLKIRTFTVGSVTDTKVSSKNSIYAPTKTSMFTNLFSPSKSVVIGGVKTPVDSFGLPDPIKTPDYSFTKNIGESPLITPTNPITKTDSPSLADIFAEQQAETQASTRTNLNSFSLTNVPVIVPDKFPLFPAGRLSEGGGAGGRTGRIGYFNEFAAVFGNIATRRAGRPVRVNRKARAKVATMQRKKLVSFVGFPNFYSKKTRRGR